MEKFLASENLSMSERRIRTHAEWKVDTHMRRARLPTRSATLARISAAALLVKVIARIEPGWTPRSPIRWAIRLVRTLVLPDPAPATTSRGEPECSTAARWGGFSPSSRSVPGVGAGPSPGTPTGLAGGGSNRLPKRVSLMAVIRVCPREDKHPPAPTAGRRPCDPESVVPAAT